MKKIKIILGLLLTLLFAFNLTSCSKTSSETSSKEESGLKTLKIGLPGQSAELGENPKLAVKLGYMEEELKKVGYKAEYVGFAQAGPAINEAFAAKEIDLAYYAEFPQIVARSNGVNIKAIAAGNSEQQYAILVQRDGNVKSVKDLEGKKVIVGLGTITHKYFGDVVKSSGLDESKIQVINTVADAQSIFGSKQADAMLTTYLMAVYLESNRTGKVLETTIDRPESSAGFILAGRDEYLKENPKAATAIIKALIRSSQYAGKNPDKVYEAIQDKKIPLNIYKEIYSYDPAFSYYNPELTDRYKKKAQSVHDFLYSNKLISKKVDLNDLFDDTYYKKAVEELGSK